MDLTLPRETNEFVPIPVTQGDVPTQAFEVAITRWPARPTSFSAAAIVGSEAGVVATGLTHGTWQVWVRVNGAIVPAGTIWVD